MKTSSPAGIAILLANRTYPKVTDIVKLRSTSLTVALAAVALAALAANNNIVEEVAWMVGDQPIYKSEIEEAYQQMLYEKTPINGDPYCIIPEQLALEKLFLHQADIDTVEVQESMVTQAVEQRINYLISNLGSKEKVEEYFRKPLAEFPPADVGKYAQPIPGAGSAAQHIERPQSHPLRRAPLLFLTPRRLHTVHPHAGRGRDHIGKPQNPPAGNRRR